MPDRKNPDSGPVLSECVIEDELEAYQHVIESMQNINPNTILNAQLISKNDDELFQELFLIAWRADMNKLNRRPVELPPGETISPLFIRESKQPSRLGRIFLGFCVEFQTSTFGALNGNHFKQP
jgi:hypothetical protein